ncbi:siderophore ABC transporter substrate-binding protein [Paenibacillus sp. EC2-1]|uniref:siderophore ABC transporter substrate-binding protein n=1 Tax=Paenibacillus sp. EC2-1 TaxID=3388665 RepID=UPI003BEEE21B
MKKVLMLLMVTVFTLALAACGSDEKKDAASGNGGETSGDKITIKHQLDTTTISKNPKKIVVFDFGVLDSLDKLGVEVTGVPQANIPPYLSKFEDAKYENVGSLKEPDFEKINKIKPDLIIISGRQSDAYKELSEIAPTIFMGVDTSKYMDSFKENMNTLGQIFGKEDQVKSELESIDKEIATLNEKVKATGKNALIILANEGKISAYGPGSRFGILHDVFGFTAVDPGIEVSTHGKDISSEYIVEKDPEYLFVVDRGAVVATGQNSGAKDVVENELVKTTSAYKDGNIVYLDPNYWYLSGGGLTSVTEMVKEVSAGVK